MSKIQEIEKRWAAATPGPWSVIRLPDSGYCEIDSPHIPSHLPPLAKLYGYPACSCCKPGKNERLGVSEDAEAIANAPSDIAYLLAEVKRLKSALRGVESIIRQGGGPWDAVAVACEALESEAAQ